LPVSIKRTENIDNLQAGGCWHHHRQSTLGINLWRISFFKWTFNQLRGDRLRFLNPEHLFICCNRVRLLSTGQVSSADFGYLECKSKQYGRCIYGLRYDLKPKKHTDADVKKAA